MSPVTDDQLAIIDGMHREHAIRAGEEFAAQALKRLESRLQGSRNLNGFIRSHANHILLTLILIVNLMSVGIGLRCVIRASSVSSNKTAEMPGIYFIDTSASQLYNFCK